MVVMKKALFAGSFDPFTNGHLDIVKQASEIFDEVIVAVAYNSQKQSFLPVEKRLGLIIKVVAGIDNVSVDSYEGLTVDYAKRNDVSILIRGIRNSSDFEYEQQIAAVNQTLASDIKTVLLTPKAENMFISSTIVREIYLNNGDISKLVPSIWE
jgi:pantetheine-phosphate adenylyltransferase